MVFKADAAFALELLALIAATALWLWATNFQGSAKRFALTVSYFSMVAAILTLLCTAYFSFRYWEKGYFHHAVSFPGEMMESGGGGTMGGPGFMGRRGLMGIQGLGGGEGRKSPDFEQRRRIMRERMENMLQQGGAATGEPNSSP